MAVFFCSSSEILLPKPKWVGLFVQQQQQLLGMKWILPTEWNF
jgi:hypothetical protein